MNLRIFYTNECKCCRRSTSFCETSTDHLKHFTLHGNLKYDF